MEQQINSFNSLKDFQKSNFKALTGIELQLKNFDFNSKQLDELNTSLKKCQKLESLVLNLQQECIQDDELNPPFTNYQWLIDLIPNFNNTSNDQRYSHMQFLLKNYIEEDFQIKPKKSGQISVLRDFLKDDTISNLANLKRLKLNLSGNSINDKSAFTICAVIGRFKMLTNLNLQLCDAGISNIGVGISCCLNLTNLILNIAKNQFGSKGAFYIGRVLSACKQLIYLDLNISQNQIGDGGASAISIGLSSCQLLTYLNLQLWENKLTDKGVQDIVLALRNCIQLKNLELSIIKNNIGIEESFSFGAILDRFKQLTNLKIDLSINQIGDKTASQMLQDLSKCTQIKDLQLSKMQLISNTVASQIEQGQSNQTQTTNLKLNISKNQIGNEGACAIGRALSNFKLLTNLTFYL
ncbi:hypothetical protein ABPG74_001995, partial [Tetrahymena malaccensis]